MSDKFTNADIKEIASKLKWKPNKISYSIIIILILIIIILVILVIYIIVLSHKLDCKINNLNTYVKNLEIKNDKINKITSEFQNKNEQLTHNILKNSNEIRYLTSLSGRHTNNSNLFEKTGLEIPIFANQVEDLNLYTALTGN